MYSPMLVIRALVRLLLDTVFGKVDLRDFRSRTQ